MALQAATLHQLSGGRLLLGLGVQARGYVAGWHDREYRRPVEAMRDFVTILRRAFGAGSSPTRARSSRCATSISTSSCRSAPLPIYIAANGPRMLELAGELADGIVGWYQSVEYVEQVTLPALRRGAERAGRSLDGFEATIGFPAVVTRDDSGLELAKGQVMMYATALGSTPAYLESARAAGFGADAEAIGELVAAGDLRGAVARVPDEMVDALVLAGSASGFARGSTRYRAAGVTGVHLLPSPPGGFYPLYEDHFPVESLAQLPEFDFAGARRAASRTRSSYWAPERAATSAAA